MAVGQSASDIVNGVISVLVNLTSIRSNPAGRDLFNSTHRTNWENTESALDVTPFRVSSVFHETITLTTTSLTLSLANADPGGASTSNSPSSAVEGKGLKILCLINHSPTDGTGQEIFIALNGSSQNAIVGLGIDYATPANAAPNESGLSLAPGGMLLWVDPIGTVAMNDGADDELRVKVGSDTAQLEILYAAG